VFCGKLARFGQDPGLQRMLLGTRERDLVQAANGDAKWLIVSEE